MIGTALTGQRLPMILQREASECGLACLTMVANFHGKQFGLQTLRELTGLAPDGPGTGPVSWRTSRCNCAVGTLQLDLADLRQPLCPLCCTGTWTISLS